MSKLTARANRLAENKIITFEHNGWWVKVEKDAYWSFNSWKDGSVWELQREVCGVLQILVVKDHWYGSEDQVPDLQAFEKILKRIGAIDLND